MGAVAVGIDQAPKQLEYARKYALTGNASNSSFVEGSIEDLSRFDDESFDLALSIHVLDYVERVDGALREAARVLKPGAVLAIAIKHPFGAHLDGPPPLHMWNSYWAPHADWPWEFKDNSSATLRHYFRTISEWLALITDVGFVIEKLFEPREADLPKAEGDELDDDWMRLVPYTLVIKARKR
jgi:ubiquinone/menaquinone biosynthesis C-methylase UbiE